MSRYPINPPGVGTEKDPDTILDTFSSISKVLQLEPHEFYKIIGPKSVQLELTNDCNLRCNMCNRWKWASEIKEQRAGLSTQDILELFKQLKELGTAHILLSGGEPLLRRDFNVLLDYLNHTNIMVTLITNGTYLPRSTAELLATTNATVIFSVDGSNKTVYRSIRGRDSFDTVIDNIRCMVEARDRARKSKVVMHFVTQKANVSDMLHFYNLCKSMDIDEVSFSIAHGPQVAERKIAIDESCIEAFKKNISALENYKKKPGKPKIVIREAVKEFVIGNIPLSDVEMGVPMLTQFKEKPVPCLSTSYWALIDAWGDVYPCCYAYLDNSSYESYAKERGKFYLGNIRKQKFMDIWEGEKFNRLRKKMNPVNIAEFPLICGQCGSYFFFIRIMSEFISLKNKADKIYEGVTDILTQAYALLGSIDSIDRSRNIPDVSDIFNKIIEL